MLIGITGSGGGHLRVALQLAMAFTAKSNIGLIVSPLAREERPPSVSKLLHQNKSCSYSRWLYRRMLPQVEVNPRTGIVPIESITPLDDDWRKRRWVVIDGKRVETYWRI